MLLCGGHEGKSRDLYPIEKCSSVIDYHPETCTCCGENLSGEDTNPYRHQIVEIPPIKQLAQMVEKYPDATKRRIL